MNKRRNRSEEAPAGNQKSKKYYEDYYHLRLMKGDEFTQGERQSFKPPPDHVKLIGSIQDGRDGKICWPLKLTGNAIELYGGKSIKVNDHVNWLLQIAVKTQDAKIMEMITELVHMGLIDEQAESYIKSIPTEKEIIIAKRILVDISKSILDDGKELNEAIWKATSQFATFHGKGIDANFDSALKWTRGMLRSRDDYISQIKKRDMFEEGEKELIMRADEYMGDKEGPKKRML